MDWIRPPRSMAKHFERKSFPSQMSSLFFFYLHIHNGFDDFIAHKITQDFKSSFCFVLLISFSSICVSSHYTESPLWIWNYDKIPNRKKSAKWRRVKNLDNELKKATTTKNYARDFSVGHDLYILFETRVFDVYKKLKLNFIVIVPVIIWKSVYSNNLCQRLNTQ